MSLVHIYKRAMVFILNVSTLTGMLKALNQDRSIVSQTIQMQTVFNQNTLLKRLPHPMIN